MNNFQTILLAVFLAFFVFAVLIFSGLLKIGDSQTATTSLQGTVTIWGTFNSNETLKSFEDANSTNKDLSIKYIKKDETTYQQDLIEAFAKGSGPDLFFITPDMAIKYENFIYKIPYTSYPEKTYLDSFIDGANIFLTKDGSLGFPMVVDPIVMYYNKDILSNEGFSKPPEFWDELFDMSSKLTKKKNDGSITQSMIALGRYDNINNAKDILATLIIQSGNSIIKRTDTGYEAVLNRIASSDALSVDKALNFFVEFSNPSDSAYSWNRALPNSLDMFTGGKLAMYVGFASELFSIQSTNPNLSFDVSQILQTQNAQTKRTYGKIYALAVNKKSTNLVSSFGLGGLMSTGDNDKNFAAAVSLPPASRAVLAIKPTDPYLFTFFNAAIISQSWLDPNSSTTDNIFSEMINSILSNKTSVSDAISRTQSQLDQIVNNK